MSGKKTALIKPVLEFMTILNIAPFTNSDRAEIHVRISHPRIVNYFTDQFCDAFFFVPICDNPGIYMKFGSITL